MADETKDQQDRSPDEQLDDVQQGVEAGEVSPKEQMRKTLHIAMLMSYDLIDKLRYLEKEAATLPDDDVSERLEELVESVELLRAAYLGFADQNM